MDPMGLGKLILSDVVGKVPAAKARSESYSAKGCSFRLESDIDWSDALQFYSSKCK